MSEVTTEDAKRFLGEACRNWSYLRFNKDDLEDVRASLQRHREAAVAELRAENERLREALGKIESHETKCVMPWTHEIAADTYAAGIDRLRWIARAALSKETSHDD